jgi:cytochrome bd-type quinol oxidase subunit 2
MKKIYLLIGIYLVALSISIFGYIIDADPVTISFAHQMFEVIMLSVVVFGILMVPLYILYFISLFFKRITKGNTNKSNISSSFP